MKYKLLSFASIFVFILFSCKKNNPNLDLRKLIFKENADSITAALKNFDFISNNPRTNFFNDQFTGNSNGWPLYNQFTNVNNIDGFAKIQNGEYYISGSGTGYVGFSIVRVLDTSKNFEINVRVKNEESLGSNSQFNRQGVFFRGNIVSGRVIGTGMFLVGRGISTSQEFSLRTITATQDVGTDVNVPIPNDYYYVYTFRKIKNKFSVFVNQKFIGLYNSNTLYAPGNLLGFAANSRMRIDYLTIDYITF